jgi:hypothetical protein
MTLASPLLKPLLGTLFITVVGLALAPARAVGQVRTTIAVDATVGAGYGSGGEFFDRDLIGARVAASLRRSDRGRRGYFGELAVDWLSLNSSHAAVGYPSSRGGFKDPYPSLLGPTAIVGLVTGSASRLEGRVGAGGGVYGSNSTRVGAVLSQVDATLFPTAHVGIVAGARWIVVPRFRGDRLQIIPWMIGLRLR